MAKIQKLSVEFFSPLFELWNGLESTRFHSSKREEKKQFNGELFECSIYYCETSVREEVGWPERL